MQSVPLLRTTDTHDPGGSPSHRKALNVSAPIRPAPAVRKPGDRTARRRRQLPSVANAVARPEATKATKAIVQ